MIVNFNTYTDDDFVQNFKYTTSIGSPIPFRSNSLRMHVRANAADPTVFIECSTDNGYIMITDGPNGEFKLWIPLSGLLNLTPGSYVHSLIMTDYVTNIRNDIWRGTLTHQAGPTRWK
jgi:hypothetical protein